MSVRTRTVTPAGVLLAPLVFFSAGRAAAEDGLRTISRAPVLLPTPSTPQEHRAVAGFPVEATEAAVAAQEARIAALAGRGTPNVIASTYVGFPLLDDEQVLVDKWMVLDGAVGEGSERLQQQDDRLVGIRLTESMAKPEVEIHYAGDAAPDSLIADVRALVGDAEVTAVVSPLTRSAYDTAVQRWIADFASYRDTGVASGGMFARLANTGVHVTSVGYHRSRVQFGVTVLPATAIADDEVANLVVEQLSTIGLHLDPLYVTVTRADAPSDGATRLDDPGQAKAGLRLSLGGKSCTGGAMFTKGAVRYMAISGHCFDGLSTGTAVLTSDGRTIGQTTTLKANDNAGVDAGLILITDEGYASEYFLAVTSTYRAHEWLVGAPSAVHTYYCMEGASQNRVTYVAGGWNTACGNYQLTTWDNYLQLGIKFCHGDSGSLVRNGSTAMGVASKLIGAGFGGPKADLCSQSVGVTRYTSVQSKWGVALLSRWSGAPDTPVSYVALNVLHSANCLDGNWTPSTTGTPLYQWACHGDDPQRFALVPRNDIDTTASAYEIKRFGSLGICVDMNTSAYIGNGTQIWQWGCHGQTNQIWRILSISSQPGYFNIRNGYDSRCLDVSGVSTADGALVHAWVCGTGLNQRWRVM